jgi:SAM-dependent methyltransferase
VPGFISGKAELFDDHRIKLIESIIEGFFGKTVLELGPLEGGHTSMLARRGAKSILAIESNKRAFVRCLIVKNALRFDADFLLGNFQSYLREMKSKVDFVLASGVLYHMHDPISLLEDVGRITDCFGIWSHYYDDTIIRSNPELAEKFSNAPSIKTFRQIEVPLYEQRYLRALEWKGFSGGAAENSFWMTRDSMFSIIEKLGFGITVAEDVATHPNGPCVLFVAKRNR